MSQRKSHMVYNEDTHQYEKRVRIRVRPASDVPTFFSMVAVVRGDAARAAERVRTVLQHSLEIRADFALAQVILIPSIGAVPVKYYASIQTFSDKPHVSISVYLYDVKSLKTDERLLSLLERAVTYAKETAQSTSDYASEYSAERTFNFTLPCGGTFSITASIASDSASCRKVKTGVTLREEATYEIQCD